MSNQFTKERVYGWYDRADQPVDQPTYDPSFTAPCLYCGEPLTEADIRTHSLMKAENAERSFFYRTHRTCDEGADETMKRGIFILVIDAIEHNGDMR